MKATKEQLKQAVIDLLDGSFEWYEIHEATGLDEKRCRELEALYVDVIGINARS